MIFKTDQFKQAKSVDIAMIMKLNVEDLVKFSHLKKFKSWLISENTFQDVPRLLDNEVQNESELASGNNDRFNLSRRPKAATGLGDNFIFTVCLT
ncbi:unnamed protein product [Caenorhabditis nigoni]